MIHDRLVLHLERLRKLNELQKDFFPQLTDLSDEVWKASELGDVVGNVLCDSYNLLSVEDRISLGKSLKEIPTEDLVALQGVSSMEMEGRRGLALLQEAARRVHDQIQESERYLYNLQVTRELAPFELERRSRQKTIAEGGHIPLDQFLARFIFGPPPPPMVPPGIKEGELKPKNFFIARVKSGKRVYVHRVHFTIPGAYDGWLMSVLKAQKLDDTSKYGYCVPGHVNQAIAKCYYNLGFKPDTTTTFYYQLRWHNGGWNNGWYYTHSRICPTKELVPVD